MMGPGPGRTLALALAMLLAVPIGVAAQVRIVAVDSSASIELPASFIPAPLNDGAVLQFADTATEAYVLVIIESKEDLTGWNLTRHSFVTLSQIVGSLDMPEVGGPEHLQIGGSPAVQHVVRGSMQGMRVAYVHTSIESPHAFAQVLAWTLGSMWRLNEQRLRDITASVQLHTTPGTIDFDIRTLAQNTWAWEHGPETCTGLRQKFEIAPDGKTMTIHHSEPIEMSDGSTTSLTNYVVEGGTARVLHTYIPDETRLDEKGAPVKWDLVLIARNRLAWRRADWPEDVTTGMLRPCAAP